MDPTKAGEQSPCADITSLCTIHFDDTGRWEVSSPTSSWWLCEHQGRPAWTNRRSEGGGFKSFEEATSQLAAAGSPPDVDDDVADITSAEDCIDPHAAPVTRLTERLNKFAAALAEVPTGVLRDNQAELQQAATEMTARRGSLTDPKPMTPAQLDGTPVVSLGQGEYKREIGRKEILGYLRKRR